MNEELKQTPSPWKRRFLILLVITVIIPGFIGLLFLKRFTEDIPVDYANPTEHFKYGSTGGEHEMGFPYWIWKALPEVCPQHSRGGTPGRRQRF